MLALLLLAAAANAASSTPGCGSAAPIPLNTRHNTTASASKRPYMYWLPPSYKPDAASPLILSFHGAQRTSDWQADLDRLTDPAFNTNHILVYPQAETYGEDGDTYWQGSPGATANDVAYTMNILDDLEKTLCIDQSRIYSSGKSQGGGFSGVLACDATASSRIAAFAAVSGAFYVNTTKCEPDSVAIPCHPGRPKVPVIEFHGGNDQTINITGGPRSGECLPSIQHWVKEWVARDGLDPNSVQVTNITSAAHVRSYGSGSLAGLVTWVYDGDRVDHDWPATFNNTDNLAHHSGPASFNASTIIMDFFGNYSLPNGGTSTSTASLPNSTATTRGCIPTDVFTIMTETAGMTWCTGSSTSTTSSSSPAGCIPAGVFTIQTKTDGITYCSQDVTFPTSAPFVTVTPTPTASVTSTARSTNTTTSAITISTAAASSIGPGTRAALLGAIMSFMLAM